MQKGDGLTLLRQTMVLINLALTLFLCAVFVLTPWRAARQAESIDFLQGLSDLPVPPWSFSLAVVGFAAFLAVDLLYRYGRLGNGRVAFLLEPLFALVIILTLHLEDTGLLLLCVVNLVDGLHGRNRVLFLTAMTGLYLLTSLNVLQAVLSMVPLSEYLAYYEGQAQQLMQTAIGLLSTLNLLLFVGYMVVLVGQRTEENAAIRRLNGELAHANDQLSVLNAQLKAYAAQSERMAETRERNRLAREIHDTLGHALTGITAGADACIQMMDVSPEMARKQMELIAETARAGINEVRRSVSALRPDALERFQLSEALVKMCREMQQTSHAEIELSIEPTDMRLSSDEEDAVYRIVQESVTNAIRHGHATRIEAALSIEDRQLSIVVQDNGVGCAQIEPGFGLRHMRERLRLLGGHLQFSGGNGFRIQATIPLRWGDEI
ncbi:MAG: sensor histidine kinase [Butyricicoccus sp.]|nr:sensor histidine kinase [Butyricicoccus sp.]